MKKISILIVAVGILLAAGFATKPEAKEEAQASNETHTSAKGGYIETNAAAW